MIKKILSTFSSRDSFFVTCIIWGLVTNFSLKGERGTLQFQYYDLETMLTMKLFGYKTNERWLFFSLLLK